MARNLHFAVVICFYVIINRIKINLSKHISLAIFSVIIIIIAGLAAIPVFGLTAFHIGLVAMGRTTNEQVMFYHMISCL